MVAKRRAFLPGRTGRNETAAALIEPSQGHMPCPSNQLAVVTDASTGIGLELAQCCAQAGFNLVIAANEPEIDRVAVDLRRLGGGAESVQADLPPPRGSTRCVPRWAIGRSTRCWPMSASASARHSQQDFARVKHLVDTNITGTLYLVHLVGNEMLRRNAGRILIKRRCGSLSAVASQGPKGSGKGGRRTLSLKRTAAVMSAQKHDQDDQRDRNSDEPKQNGHGCISSVSCQ